MMMTKAEEDSARAADECFIKDADTDDVYIDLESFWRDMGSFPTDPPQDILEDFSFLNIPEGLQAALSPGAEVHKSSTLSPSYNSEVSDCRTGCSDVFSESAGNSIGPDEKLEYSLQLNFTEQGYPRNVTDHVSDQGNGLCFVQSGASEFCFSNCEDDQFRYSGVDASSNNLHREKIMEETDRMTSFIQMDGSSIFNGDKTSHDTSRTESSSYDVNGAEITDPLTENSSQYALNSYEPPFPPHSPVFTSFNSDYHWMDDIMDYRKKHDDNFNVIPYKHLVGNEVGHHNAKYGNGTSTILNRIVDMHDMRIQPKGPSPNTLFNLRGKVQSHIDVKNNYESITSKDIVSRASGVIGDVMCRNYHLGSGESTATEGISWSSSKSPSLISHKNYIPPIKDESVFLESDRTFPSLGMIGETAVRTSSIHDPSSVLGLLGQPGIHPSPSVKAELNCFQTEHEVPKFNGLCLPNITYKEIPSNTLEHTNADEDSDLQIIEDLSQRAVSTATNGKLIAESHFSSSRTPAGQLVTGHSKIKANDERVIYRVALQDLSQPKSEATPPEGLLAVPLLKHQRIALFWMVNKEKNSACCSGGILADDQGLGKTVSTIALILKERSPSSKESKAIKEQIKTETLNLDEDDEAPETYNVKERAEPCQNNDLHMYGGKACMRTKGRPAAGTLIVCPTSVLRQWSEELHNKVTDKANLSVLVYHGSNRTKDLLELAKYDVVVTTYAIVSMEVPKQPNVNDLDDSLGTSYQGFSSCKKRKLLGTMSDKKSSKSKKSKNGDENELLETISGPLAKVAWFRVVLDEAQSIKNHRTQVARACWGLRAKRRWCLSGTPIQNTIDDLYSYFRFLRHEPYAVFKTFCDQIKVPISRNPKNGFKKLQAVLKTIMLRRTKGTLLDGEPIINLPPKSIELKQVDFSKEELDFYRTLEADSRAQFAEYAANGTVEQNYVNILLMLLRLRQACDHPLLVKQCKSKSNITSSSDMAMKLPRNRQVFLLNSLEASLAICGICGDPPEDAVVTVCGHVFCNQCICEHMLGDDHQCPAKNCKQHLNMSHVFSITSLRNALSDHSSLEGTTQCNDSEILKGSEPYLPCYPQESSKIKAALKILLSLSKPHDCASRMSSPESIREGYCSGKLPSCDSGGENVNENRNPNNAVPVAGEKAIVFSQWTNMLDLLEACLKNTSIQYRRLDGTMAVTARDRAVKDFNSLPQVSVIIMSLKAASLGLNMVAACRVILLDLWWNPTTEDQAIDRAHRIGQTRPVSVFRLTVKDTVEDRILALQQRKRQMVASAFGEDKTGSRETRLTVDDLKYLFMAD